MKDMRKKMLALAEELAKRTDEALASGKPNAKEDVLFEVIGREHMKLIVDKKKDAMYLSYNEYPPRYAIRIRHQGGRILFETLEL